MEYQRASEIYKYVSIFVGAIVIVYSIIGVSDQLTTLGLWLFLAIAFFCMPLMSIKLPRTKIGLSFSDSLIFLGFIIYGAYASILIGVAGTLALCLRLKRKNIIVFRKWMIPFNIASNALSTALTAFICFKLIELFEIKYKNPDSTSLFLILSFLAVFQFIISSVLHVPVSRNINKLSLWKIWKTEYFPVSLAQIGGAGVAFFAYKLIYQANFLLTTAAFIILCIVYLNYRRTIKDINDSIEKNQQLEREKAEAAERYSARLQVMLDNEEEISENLRSSKEALEYSAFNDELTDLPNRNYLVERLQFLIDIGEHLPKEYYVVFIDLSRFKNINEFLGHSIGDSVLRMVALRLRRLLRDEDTMARIGGDEFAVILPGISSMEKARKAADKLYEKLTLPFMINGNKIYSDVHIGVSPLDFSHITPEDVLRDADIAMQYAKKMNMGVAIFDKDIRDEHLEKIRIEAELRHAIEREELFMNYQPLIDLRNGKLTGFEALLRWNHSEMGYISPDLFIPISEDSGSIVTITSWILKETCLQMARWNETLDDENKLSVSVNVSGKHLTDEDLVSDVKRALRLSGLDPECLKLEITESTAMGNPEKTVDVLQRLKNLGVMLSIDDFGTGYSSLSYLHRLPFDMLKIDRSFVINSEKENSEDMNILETIVSLAKNLEKKVIAEGIETEKQLLILQNLGCEFGQGYLFSKPMQSEEVSALLKNITPWLSKVGSQIEIQASSSIELDKDIPPF